MLRRHPKSALFSLLLLCVPMAVLADEVDTPAEKIRKTLDKAIVVNFAGRDLKEVAEHLKAKTGIEFRVGPEVNLDGNPQPPGGNPTKYELKADANIKLGRALQCCLSRHRMTYVILEDSVVILSEDEAVSEQLEQLVSVHIEKVPLAKALKELQRTTPFNLVIDPRVSKEAATSISMDIDNTMLESTVRLMAELAGLRAVRVDNVLLICDEARYEKVWRAEKAAENMMAGRRRQSSAADLALQAVPAWQAFAPPGPPVPRAMPALPPVPIAPIAPPPPPPEKK